MADADEASAARISTACGIHPLIARLLVIRGISTPEQAEAFLYADEGHMHDPFLMSGMQEAVDRIQAAIEKKEKIRIYGDYDADGVCSSALLARMFKRLNAQADVYIPHRIQEGYGLNKAAIDRAKREDISLIVTVDNGISAAEETDYARQLGIDVIVTDHHEPPEQLPDAAYTIINPKQTDCPYPFKQLAGVGVAYKLAIALTGMSEPEWRVIAAIGTIADLVPLVDENRVLVKSGLQALQDANIPGLRALIEVAGVGRDPLTEMNVAFQLAPRINAGGRMSDAEPAVRLLMTEDEQEAKELAQELDRLNRERQKLVEEMTAEAFSMMERERMDGSIDDERVIVVGKAGWNVGVVGIVASKIVEKTNKPAIVLSFDEVSGLAKGSARSIEAFDIHRALTECADLLDQFGGHRAAGGMTLKIEQVGPFRKRLNELAHEWLSEDDFVPISHADLECSIHEISENVIEQLEWLAPFGVGNPPPRFVFRNVRVRDMRLLGQKRNHLKLVLEPLEPNGDIGQTLEAIAFDRKLESGWISSHANLNVYGEVGFNEWNGIRKRQLTVQDLGVNEPQLFDWRNRGSVEEQLARWLNERRELGLDRSPALLFGKPPQTFAGDAKIIVLDPFDKSSTIAAETEPLRKVSDLILLSLPRSANEMRTLIGACPRARTYICRISSLRFRVHIARARKLQKSLHRA